MSSTTSTVRLATLDIAGTTVDEGGAVYRVLADVVADAGVRPDDAAVRHWMGADKREALRALTGLDAGADVEALHSAFVDRLGRAYAATPPQPFPGVTTALAALRAGGVAVVLTTGFDRQVTDPLLAMVALDVDAVVCAEEAGAGRPSPAMIERAMALTAVADPAQVLVAGDTVLDIESGRAAGAGVVVGVLTGAQTRAELEAAGPTDVVPGVADLPALLGPGVRSLSGGA